MLPWTGKPSNRYRTNGSGTCSWLCGFCWCLGLSLVLQREQIELQAFTEKQTNQGTRTTTITTNEEHEADKLQNDSAPATSLQDAVITEDVPTLVTETESLNTSSKIDAQPETQVTAGVQEEEVEVAAVNAFADSDSSWMYDPLLNLMILLLSVICYLLFDKFVSLREELALLQEENNM